MPAVSATNPTCQQMKQTKEKEKYLFIQVHGYNRYMETFKLAQKLTYKHKPSVYVVYRLYKHSHAHEHPNTFLYFISPMQYIAHFVVVVFLFSLNTEVYTALSVAPIHACHTVVCLSASYFTGIVYAWIKCGCFSSMCLPNVKR